MIAGLTKSKIPALKAYIGSTTNRAEAKQLQDALEAEAQAFVLWQFRSTVLNAHAAIIEAREAGK